MPNHGVVVKSVAVRDVSLMKVFRKILFDKGGRFIDFDNIAI